MEYLVQALHNFDDKIQLQMFEEMLNSLMALNRDVYYYFSVGEERYGDGHEDQVMKLNNYFSEKQLPTNFKWKLFHEKYTNHFTSYGLSVGNGLNEIFLDYRNILGQTFELLGKMKIIERVPWSDVDKIFSDYSTRAGFMLKPDLMFFNSVASYFTYAINVKESSRTILIEEVLVKAIELYPFYDGFHSWLGDLYIKKKNKQRALYHLDAALKLVYKNSFISAKEKKDKELQLLATIRNLENMKQEK